MAKDKKPVWPPMTVEAYRTEYPFKYVYDSNLDPGEDDEMQMFKHNGQRCKLTGEKADEMQQVVFADGVKFWAAPHELRERK
jgi:hypothetical protein